MMKPVQMVITRVDEKTYKITLMTATQTILTEYVGRMNLSLRISELVRDLEPVDV